MKAEYQSQLADANAQRDAILRDAAAKAQRREEDVLAAANREADAIREKARADIVREKKQALNDVKDDISGMAGEGRGEGAASPGPGAADFLLHRQIG